MDDFAALRAHRRQLIACDAAFGSKVRHDDAKAFEAVVDQLEHVELAIMSAPAVSEEHAVEKLLVLAHNINRGADAEHVGHLFELARPDLARHPSVAA